MNISEDFFHSSRDYPSRRIVLMIFEPLHRISLPRSSLTICQYGGIVSLKHRHHCWSCRTIIDQLLSTIWPIDLIKCECVIGYNVRILGNISLAPILSHFCPQILLDSNLFVILAYLNYWHKVHAILHFPGKRGSDTYDHPKVLVLIRVLGNN